MKPILVSTQHRGVFFGFVDDDTDLTQRTFSLKDSRMAIRWSTTKGIAELAEDGPNSGSRVGAKADLIALHDVTAVWECTEKAVKAWTTHKNRD